MTTNQDSQDPFDRSPELYDRLIDWPKRLANEAELYRAVFERHSVESVLDVACGTGHHAELFRSWGLQVEGADVSARMIEHCREAYGENEDLRWVVRAFDAPLPDDSPFGAVVCVGNSLGLARDDSSLRSAVSNMLSAVRSGGVVIIQVVNLWRQDEGPAEWRTCKRFRLPTGQDHIRLKGIHRVGRLGHVEIIDLDLVGEKVESQFHSAVFLGIEADDVVQIARSAGAGEVEVFGSFEREAYDRRASPDIVIVAARA